MRQLARDYALVIAAAAVVFFTNLGGPRLWDRDEPRNAGCAREMLAAGDWVTPIFNAELRTHKPVLLYWLMMTAYAAFGDNEFGARFWSAALGVGTVVATYHLGRRLFNASVGVWAGVILSSTLMFGVAARAATPDSVLIFFSTLPLLVFVLATCRRQPMHGTALPASAQAPEASSNPDNLPPRLLRSNDGSQCLGPCRALGQGLAENYSWDLTDVNKPLAWPLAVGMYALMGLAVLAKGPVGLVLPTAVLGMFLLLIALPHKADAPWWRRTFRPFAPRHFLLTCWRMRPLTALATSLAVALPWYLWVHVRTDGAWTQGFFLTHNLGRATTAMEGHDGSVFFYPLAVLVGFFPWSVFAVPIAIDLTVRLRKGDPWRWGYLFAACWVAVYVGLFSLAKTKLPSYITPMYPGLALLAGCFVDHWTRGTAQVAKRWPRMALGALALVGVVILVAVPLAARRFAPGEEVLGALGLLPIGAAAVSFYWMEKGRTLAAARVLAGGAVALATLAFGYAATRADRHQQSDLLLRAIADHSADPTIGAWGCLEPSWVYYAGRPIRAVDETQLTATAGGWFGPDREAFVITTRRRLQDLGPRLPPEVEIIAEAPYFLRDEQLVVLGRRNSLAIATSPAPATRRAPR